MRRAIELGSFLTAVDYLCFYLDFCTSWSKCNRERAQLRSKVNNNRRVRKSSTVQRIENDIVLRDDDTAKRSRQLLYLSTNSGFIRDAYFENDVGQVSARWRSRARRQYKSALDISVSTWFSNTDLCRAQATIIHMIRCHLGAAILVW